MSYLPYYWIACVDPVLESPGLWGYDIPGTTRCRPLYAQVTATLSQPSMVLARLQIMRRCQGIRDNDGGISSNRRIIE